LLAASTNADVRVPEVVARVLRIEQLDERARLRAATEVARNDGHRVAVPELSEVRRIAERHRDGLPDDLVLRRADVAARLVGIAGRAACGGGEGKDEGERTTHEGQKKHEVCRCRYAAILRENWARVQPAIQAGWIPCERSSSARVR